MDDGNIRGSFPVLHGGEVFLYRIYGDEPLLGRRGVDVLLYVGITNDLGQRAHRGRRETREWFRNARRIDWQVCASRAAAERAERSAILKERPLYNIQHGGVDWPFYVELNLDPEHHDPGCPVGAANAKRLLALGNRFKV